MPAPVRRTRRPPGTGSRKPARPGRTPAPSPAASTTPAISCPGTNGRASPGKPPLRNPTSHGPIPAPWTLISACPAAVPDLAGHPAPRGRSRPAPRKRYSHGSALLTVCPCCPPVCWVSVAAGGQRRGGGGGPPGLEDGGRDERGQQGKAGRDGHGQVVTRGQRLRGRVVGQRGGIAGRDGGDNGQADGAAELLRGGDQPGGQASLAGRHAGGGGRIGRGEAHAEADRHDQEARQQMERVAAMHGQEADPGHPGGHEGRAEDEVPPVPVPGDQPAHLGGHHAHDHRERDKGQPGADRAVVLHELQVQREQEEHAQVARVDRGHRGVGPGNVPVPEDGQRHERIPRPPLVQHEPGQQSQCPGQRRQRPGAGPAPVRGLAEVEHRGHRQAVTMTAPGTSSLARFPPGAYAKTSGR